MKKIRQRLSAVSAEILLITGAFFIAAATATISITATIYFVGLALSALGFFIAKGRR